VIQLNDCIIIMYSFIIKYFRFRLDQIPTSLLLNPPLEDKVSDDKNETETIIFARVSAALRT
jgi:hypothetical protein